jgi:hypothetical protein
LPVSGDSLIKPRAMTVSEAYMEPTLFDLRTREAANDEPEGLSDDTAMHASRRTTQTERPPKATM